MVSLQAMTASRTPPRPWLIRLPRPHALRFRMLSSSESSRTLQIHGFWIPSTCRNTRAVQIANEKARSKECMATSIESRKCSVTGTCALVMAWSWRSCARQLKCSSGDALPLPCAVPASWMS